MGFAVNLIFFLPVVALASFVSYLWHGKTAADASYPAYVPRWLRRHWLLILICCGLLVVPSYGGFIADCLLAAVLAYQRFWPKGKFYSQQQMRGFAEERAKSWLSTLGARHEDRVAAIDALFEARTATMDAAYFTTWSRVAKGEADAKSYMFFRIDQSIATMDNRVREHLRIVEILNSAAEGQDERYQMWRVGLLWSDGKGRVYDWQAGGTQRGKQANHLSGRGGSGFESSLLEHYASEKMVNAVQQELERLRTLPILDPKYKLALNAASERVTPSGSGSWLKPTDVASSIFAENGGFPLHIGSFADGTRLAYSGEGSVVTIAPPGAGKTQCNVFPNLLDWRGPAVVLDISGDIYEHTAAWRAANVGPVYKFNPLEPQDSHRYNPLTFVRREPDYIWEDARLLAEMMIVPAMTSDPFWENEARTVLTAAIAYVCYYNPPTDRPMHAVLDVLFGGKAWDDMLRGLSMAVDVRVMTQHATALEEMNEKTRNSVLQTARSSLGAWSGERVARATSASDWDPADLRSGTNPTIYIYIRPNEVEAYLSLLRVFIGQHIRILTGGAVPPRGAAPILFMLDELPRLRYMAPVDEALNIGRKYGLRLWMFAQSVGQLQTAYENGDGMLGSCAVRIFMNPSGADGMAERLSEELGYVDSITDNSRRRLVDAVELAGPAFKQQQIVIGVGTKPARVTKDFAYNDPELSSRMAMPATTVATTAAL